MWKPVPGEVGDCRGATWLDWTKDVGTAPPKGCELAPDAIAGGMGDSTITPDLDWMTGLLFTVKKEISYYWNNTRVTYSNKTFY